MELDRIRRLVLVQLGNVCQKAHTSKNEMVKIWKNLE